LTFSWAAARIVFIEGDTLLALSDLLEACCTFEVDLVELAVQLGPGLRQPGG
jgi:hypothetical protein